MEGNKFITHEAYAESFSVLRVEFTERSDFTAFAADGRTAKGVVDDGDWIIVFVYGRTVRPDSAVATRIAAEHRQRVFACRLMSSLDLVSAHCLQGRTIIGHAARSLFRNDSRTAACNPLIFNGRGKSVYIKRLVTHSASCRAPRIFLPKTVLNPCFQNRTGLIFIPEAQDAPMPNISFPYNDILISVRRQAAPAARWDAATKSWMMSAADLQAFQRDGDAALTAAGTYQVICVGGTQVRLGAAPKPAEAPTGRIQLPAGCFATVERGVLCVESSGHYTWHAGAKEVLASLSGLKPDMRASLDDQWDVFVGEPAALDAVRAALSALHGAEPVAPPAPSGKPAAVAVVAAEIERIGDRPVGRVPDGKYLAESDAAAILRDPSGDLWLLRDTAGVGNMGCAEGWRVRGPDADRLAAML